MKNRNKIKEKLAFIEVSKHFCQEMQRTIEQLEQQLDNFAPQQAQDLDKVNKLLDLAYTAYNSCCGLVDEIEVIQQNLMFDETDFEER